MATARRRARRGACSVQRRATVRCLCPFSQPLPLPSGPAATAEVRFEPLSAGGSRLVGTFTLMVRVPEWVAAGRDAKAGPASLSVNGQLWSSCPGAPAPSSYCQITRSVPPASGMCE